MKSLITFFAGLFLATTMSLHAGSLFDIPVKDIGENETSLAPYKGKVMLIVNVASRCGLTPQYEALEALYQEHKDAGFVVLGFPCNQFGGQEPGSNEEIASFCKKNYGVSFPLFDKIEVNGTERHPLYTELAGDHSPYPGSIKWNFTKFLVGRDGTILKRFEPRVSPDAEPVVSAVTAALAE